jgi:hypothetical protein
MRPTDCKGCAYEHTSEWTLPCVGCRRGTKDYYRKPEPKVRIEIDGKTYASDKPILKAVHGKTGEVTIGNFYEVESIECL